MKKLLKKLSGNEIKVLMVLLLESDVEHCFSPIDGLCDYDLTYPTILKTVERLKRIGAIEQSDLGNRSILRLKPSFRTFADYLRNYAFQIELKAGTLEDMQAKQANAVARKEAIRLIFYYGKAKGIPDDKINEWFGIMVPRLMIPAKQVLAYVKSIEKAFLVIDNAKIYFESKNLSWSLEKAVISNLDKLASMADSKGGDANWF